MSDETLLAAQDNTDADGVEDQTAGTEASEGDATEVDEGGSAETNQEDAGSQDQQEASEDDGAPEAYEAFEMPEGFEVDEAALAGATPIFQELGLSQAKAQKLVSFFAEHEGQRAEAMAAGHVAQVEAWETAAREQFGAEFDGTVQTAVAGLKRFDTDGKVSEVLNSTGLGSHPEVIALFNRIGKATSEDTFDGKTTTIATEKTLEDKLYGKSGQ